MPLSTVVFVFSLNFHLFACICFLFCHTVFFTSSGKLGPKGLGWQHMQEMLPWDSTGTVWSTRQRSVVKALTVVLQLPIFSSYFHPTSITLLLLIRNTFWFVMSPPNAEQNEYIFLRQLLIPLWWHVEQAPSWTSVSYGCWLPMQKDLSCCLLAVTQWCS